MKKLLNEKFIEFCNSLSKKIYIVGGYCRNFLINGKPSADIDVAGNVDIDELRTKMSEFGFSVVAEYKRTGTIVFSGYGQKYEYTRFRIESYNKGGKHTPVETQFTDDILLDAKRRDFKCNAIYYDVVNGEFVDPLNGIEDVKNKVLDTVVNPKEVFSHDGLRLMRLARFTAELGFMSTQKVLDSARENADNILDISPERIFAELKMILDSDYKYEFSNIHGGYVGLKVLDDTRVLDRILPELTAGREMFQRADFHNYDVLEHSLRAVLYADRSVRLDALLHDIGKPYAMQTDGKYALHGEYGKKIAYDVLTRFKASDKERDEASFFAKAHMIDLKGDMKESKVKRYIIRNYQYFDKLMLIKQADFSACKDCLDIAPCVIRWQEIYEKMRENKVPFCIKDLAINGNDLKNLGAQNEQIGKILNYLLDYLIDFPAKNTREFLLDLAGRYIDRKKLI